MFKLCMKDVQRVLCIGCHADDIEIGCGGTMLRLIQENPKVEIWWVVLSGDQRRAQEANKSAGVWLERLEKSNFLQADFRDRYFFAQAEQVKQFVHEVADRFAPEIVFTHRRADAHQDHRLVAEFTWQAFRDHLILEYEIPKYEGDLGAPNVFMELREAQCQWKVNRIIDVFASQRDKPWFTADVFWSLLRLRGLECQSSTSFAEGFYASKISLTS